MRFAIAIELGAVFGMAIEVHELRKAYERRPVLRGLTFSMGTGEIFGIAGRNGAGNTTTVEILQGLRRRDAGAQRHWRGSSACLK